MESKDKTIITLLIVIIIGLLVALTVAMMPLNKQNTNLSLKSESPITEGENLEIELTNSNGTPISNQTVTVTIANKKTNDSYSVVTDEKGIGTINLDKTPGNYNVTLSYDGNENYSSCKISNEITVKVAETTATSSSSSSSSSESSSLPYDINNLPPSNDPYPETRRYQVDEYTVAQEYEDNYRSYVDLRTGERHGGFF